MFLGKKYVAGYIIIIMILVAVIIFYPKPEIKEFVSTRTAETKSDLLFSYDIIKYPTGVIIYEPNASERLSVGIVSDKDNLKFGTIPGNGSYVKRYLNLTNKEGDARVSLKAYGNIGPLITFGKNNFIIHSNENMMIDLVLNTKGADFGEYVGEIDVVVQKPKADFLYSFI